MEASVAIQSLPAAPDDDELCRIVDEVIAYIASTGYNYYVGPFETTIEGPYDALMDMIPGAKLNEYMERGTIQIAPLAFMRGRTLSDAVVILDEAQNTTSSQLKMFLTRLGINGKMIVTGDLTQIDLPASQRSGLKDAIARLRDIKGIAIVEFNQKDIVRHPLVSRIVDAYSKREEEV